MVGRLVEVDEFMATRMALVRLLFPNLVLFVPVAGD